MEDFYLVPQGMVYVIIYQLMKFDSLKLNTFIRNVVLQNFHLWFIVQIVNFKNKVRSKICLLKPQDSFGEFKIFFS